LASKNEIPLEAAKTKFFFGKIWFSLPPKNNFRRPLGRRVFLNNLFIN